MRQKMKSSTNVRIGLNENVLILDLNKLIAMPDLFFSLKKFTIYMYLFLTVDDC